MVATLKLFNMKQGDSKISIALLRPHIFLKKYFHMLIKLSTWLNLKFFILLWKIYFSFLKAIFWSLLQAATICNLPRNENLWGASKTSFKELKKILHPLIDSSWCVGLEDLYHPAWGIIEPSHQLLK